MLSVPKEQLGFEIEPTILRSQVQFSSHQGTAAPWTPFQVCHK